MGEFFAGNGGNGQENKFFDAKNQEKF